MSATFHCLCNLIQAYKLQSLNVPSRIVFIVCVGLSVPTCQEPYRELHSMHSVALLLAAIRSATSMASDIMRLPFVSWHYKGYITCQCVRFKICISFFWDAKRLQVGNLIPKIRLDVVPSYSGVISNTDCRWRWNTAWCHLPYYFTIYCSTCFEC